MGLFDKLMGSHSDREVKRVMPIVKKIEALAPDMEKLSDEELRAQTDKFKERLAAGETLDDILPEAFATVREAAGRTLGYKHYRVQLIGGIILHQGRIAEMKTGEGKTLVATLPAYLNALEGKGVYVSSGSACATNRPHLSGTLQAIRLPREYMDNTIRISLSGMNTEADIRQASDALHELIPFLRKYTRH